MPLNPVPSWPASIDALPDPTSSTTEDTDGFEHDVLHVKINAIAELLEAAVGMAPTSGVDGLPYVRLHDGTSKGLWVPAQAVSAPNPILNPTFNVWQAGATFTSIASGAYGPDGWLYSNSSAAVHDLLRSTDVPAVAAAAPVGNYSLHLDCTTADASVAAGDSVAIQARVEGFDWLPYLQRQFTLGFWVKSTKTGVFCVSFRNNPATHSFVGEYTVNAANTWEWKQIVVTASTGGLTWNQTNGMGVVISWTLMAGTTLQTTAGAWNAGSFLATSSQVNAADSASNDWRIYGAVVSLGPHAAPIAPLPHAVSLERCQRYFCKTFPVDTAPAQNTGSALGALAYHASVTGATAHGQWWQFPSRMRTTPTVTLYNPSAANSNWRNTTDGADSGASSTNHLGENGVLVTNAQAAGDAAGEILAVHAAAAARL